MGRQSAVKSHAARDRIEADLASGVPGAEIARRYGVSESAISRHRISHLDALAAIAEAGVGPDLIIDRLRELAESARKSRILADESGSPATRARAQANELAALSVLIDRAGISDLTTVQTARAVGELVRALQSYIRAHPEAAPDVFAVMGAHESLIELRDALKAQNRIAS